MGASASTSMGALWGFLARRRPAAGLVVLRVREDVALAPLRPGRGRRRGFVGRGREVDGRRGAPARRGDRRGGGASRRGRREVDDVGRPAALWRPASLPRGPCGPRASGASGPAPGRRGRASGLHLPRWCPLIYGRGPRASSRRAWPCPGGRARPGGSTLPCAGPRACTGRGRRARRAFASCRLCPCLCASWPFWRGVTDLSLRMRPAGQLPMRLVPVFVWRRRALRGRPCALPSNAYCPARNHVFSCETRGAARLRCTLCEGPAPELMSQCRSSRCELSRP